LGAAFAIGILLVCTAAGVRAEPPIAEAHHYDMTVLPELDLEPWQRIGGAPVQLLPDQTLLLNDNSRDDRIGYQTLLGVPLAQHRITLAARVRVLSNLEGRAAVMEVSRPRLQAVLRLYPDHLELTERTGTDQWRWLASASLDLTTFREIELRKESSLLDPAETVRVWVDGVLELEARPSADGDLDAGRLVIGSVALPAVGASVWDWVGYRLAEPVAGVPTGVESFGSLKAHYQGTD
jgi:hypothetical protein